MVNQSSLWTGRDVRPGRHLQGAGLKFCYQEDIMVAIQGNGLGTHSCQLLKKHQEMQLQSEKYEISAKEVIRCQWAFWRSYTHVPAISGAAQYHQPGSSKRGLCVPWPWQLHLLEFCFNIASSPFTTVNITSWLPESLKSKTETPSLLQAISLPEQVFKPMTDH